MSSISGEAFGLANGPAGFDVDAWIANAGRPQRAVTLYGRADLIARLDEIDTEVKTLRRRAAAAQADQSLEHGSEAEARIAQLEDEWEALATAFSESAMQVVVRGLTEAEEASALKAAAKASPQLAKAQNAEWHELVGLHIVHAAVVSPPMSFEQVHAIYHRVGGAAFAPLANTVRTLSRQAPVVPPTPFSRPSSPPART